MPQSYCLIDPAKLETEIAKELDEMNNSGLGYETRWPIGEYLGIQVQIVLTRDEDDIMEMEEKDECIKFGNVPR